MRAITIRLIVGLLAALSSAANATGVVYNWVSLTDDADLTPTFGSMVFEESYWLSHDTFTFVSSGAVFDPAPPGLLSFSFGGGAGPGNSSSASLMRFLCTATQMDCLPNLLDQFAVYGGYDFQLTLGTLLTGSIYAKGWDSSVRMGSAGGPLWTVQSYRTDGPGPGACYSGDNCGGGTGLWVLDRNTVPVATPVPEPETYAMWAAGALIIGLSLRSRRA